MESHAGWSPQQNSQKIFPEAQAGGPGLAITHFKKQEGVIHKKVDPFYTINEILFITLIHISTAGKDSTPELSAQDN